MPTAAPVEGSRVKRALGRPTRPSRPPLGGGTSWMNPSSMSAATTPDTVAREMPDRRTSSARVSAPWSCSKVSRRRRLLSRSSVPPLGSSRTVASARGICQDTTESPAPRLPFRRISADRLLPRRSARPHADRRVPGRHVDQDQLGLFVRRDRDLLRTEDRGRVAGAETSLVHASRSCDQVEIAGAILSERVLDLGTRLEGGDVRRRVLVDRDDVAALRPDHLEQPAEPILAGELPLLDARRQRGRVGEDPELEEAHRLGLRPVAFRVQGAGAEGHPLDAAGLQRAVLSERIRVLEGPLDHVGESLDVSMRVHRPVGAGDQPVVVEDPQGPDAHLFGITVAVEREMPACSEPPALFRMDLGVPTDLQHAYPLASWFDNVATGTEP